MATKYHTLWAQPCTVGRKTLDVQRREGINSTETGESDVLDSGTQAQADGSEGSLV